MAKHFSIVSMAVFFIFALLILSFSQENLTITTYYPSPYGSYNELQLYPHNPNVTPCNAATTGTMYYDNSTTPGQIKVCEGASGNWVNIGGGVGGGTCTMVDSGTLLSPPAREAVCPAGYKLITGGVDCHGAKITESRPINPLFEKWQGTCEAGTSQVNVYAWCCQ